MGIEELEHHLYGDGTDMLAHTVFGGVVGEAFPVQGQRLVIFRTVLEGMRTVIQCLTLYTELRRSRHCSTLLCLSARHHHRDGHETRNDI